MFLKKAYEERGFLCGRVFAVMELLLGPSSMMYVNLTGELYLKMLNESIIPSLELAYNRNEFRHIGFSKTEHQLIDASQSKINYEKYLDSGF